MSIFATDAAGNRQKIAGVGLPGPAGKSAYQYAVEGGFSGTEEEFRALMGMHSNQNLLDNADFWDPINQRGQTEYTGAGYTIDRWKLNSGQFAITGKGIQTGSELFWLVQFVGCFIQIGKEYTVSAIVDGILRTATGIITDTTSFVRVMVNADIEITLSYDPNSGLWYFSLISRAVHTFSAAKIELGPVQTLAHKEGDTWVLNDPPPNKALELAKCQRYQYLLNSQEISYGYWLLELRGGWSCFHQR